jgi:hypothetical protein
MELSLAWLEGARDEVRRRQVPEVQGPGGPDEQVQNLLPGQLETTDQFQAEESYDQIFIYLFRQYWGLNSGP